MTGSADDCLYCSLAFYECVFLWMHVVSLWFFKLEERPSLKCISSNVRGKSSIVKRRRKKVNSILGESDPQKANMLFFTEKKRSLTVHGHASVLFSASTSNVTVMINAWLIECEKPPHVTLFHRNKRSYSTARHFWSFINWTSKLVSQWSRSIWPGLSSCSLLKIKTSNKHKLKQNKTEKLLLLSSNV